MSATTSTRIFDGNFIRGIFIIESGAPEGIRTPDPQIRSLVLYPLSYGRFQ